MKKFNSFLVKLLKISLALFLVVSLSTITSYAVESDSVDESLAQEETAEEIVINEQDQTQDTEAVKEETDTTVEENEETLIVENQENDTTDDNISQNQTRGSPVESNQAFSNMIPVRVNAPEELDGDYYIVLADEHNYIWWSTYDLKTNVTKVNFNEDMNISYIAQNTWNTRAYLLKLKDGRNYTNYVDTNSYDVYEDGEYIDYKYKINMNYSFETGGWTININDLGTNSIDVDTIKNGLSKVSDFAVLANEFTIDGHIEGNIAVNKVMNSGVVGNTDAVLRMIKTLKITVQKTVSPKLSTAETFTFGLFDKNDNLIETKTITTKSTGTTTFTVEKSGGFDRSDVYKVYELDSNKNKVLNNGTLGEYTVTYDSLNGGDSYDIIMGSANVNYVGSVENGVKLQGQSGIPTSLITTVEGAENWIDFVDVEVLTQEEFEKVMPIQSILDEISELSRTLAKAKSGNGVRVYNIPISALNGDVCLSGYKDAENIEDYEVAVLNIVIPKSQKNANISPSQLYLKTDEGKTYNIYNGGSWATLASKIIWNYVDEDGNPYEGSVVNAGMMIGTMLAPKATLTVGGSAADAIVGNKVIQSNEIHKVTFDKVDTREVTILCGNTASGDSDDVKETVDITVAKKWVDNEDQDGIRPDSITVRLYADGKEVKSATVTANTNWKYTFEGLDKYSNGKEIEYTVTEDAVSGYKTTISGYDITNTHETAKVEVAGTKTWVENEDQD